MIRYNEITSPVDAVAIRWPPKYDIFGVRVSATTYDEVTDVILAFARQRAPAVVSAHAAHAIVTASGDPGLRQVVNRFQAIVADGQPVRWALNLLHGTGLPDRVRGPELMLRLCAAAAQHQVPIYLYGSCDEVLEPLCANLTAQYPGLQFSGVEAPPFRALTAAEEAAVVRRINASGAGIVFVGLGYPKQDHFAGQLQERAHAVLVCVGAAFDFHAGKKRMAPLWMQRWGLEWLHRVCQEPRRLWRRYLVTNTIFAGKLAAALVRRPWRRG